MENLIRHILRRLRAAAAPWGVLLLVGILPAICEPPPLPAAPLDKYQVPPSPRRPRPAKPPAVKKPAAEPAVYQQFRRFISTLPPEKLDELIVRYSRMRMKSAKAKKPETARYYGDLIDMLYREKEKR